MRNIPVFTVDSGVASLILEEIPYKQLAYIKIQSTQMPEQLLDECVAFCKAAGAGHIFATGHAYLDQYPLHTIIYEMRVSPGDLPSTDAYAILVDQNNLDNWITLFNQRMSKVPNAASMTISAANKLMQDKCAYFVYSKEELVGLGIASGNRIQALTSIIPGNGQAVLCALAKQLSCDSLVVEVASANCKAMRLYTDLGFCVDRKIAEWYAIC